MAKTILAFLCLVMTVGVVKSKVERLWANKEVLRPGESIILTCEFTDLDSHDPTHFYKHHPGNRTATLTDNYALAESLLEEPNRYTFSYKDAVAGGVATQTLTILNAVPGDSGNYSCFMRDVDKNQTRYYVYLNITVEDEPDTIKLYVDDIEVYNGSNSVPLKFLQIRKLRCETTHSNPGANITITTGNGKPVHLCSITVSNATYEFSERDPKHDFIVPIYRNTTVEATKWRFDADAYGKPVVCLAKVNKDAPGIMTSFIPVVADGLPEIECNDTFYARDGQRNFVLNCSTYAKPSITKAMFFVLKDGVNSTIDGFPLNAEHSSKDGKFRGIIQKYDDIKSSMRLTVETVDLKAAISFNFVVSNEYGQDIHGIVIKDPSMASSSTALSTSLIAFLFIWLIGFGIRGQL